MSPRHVIFGLLTAAILLASCGKPRELPYSQLGYRDCVLTEPGTGAPFTGIAKDSYKDGRPKAEYSGTTVDIEPCEFAAKSTVPLRSEVRIGTSSPSWAAGAT